MARVKYSLVIVLLALAVGCSDSKQAPTAKSLPDTPENRTAAAKRYLEVVPPQTMLRQAMGDIAERLPEKSRKIFEEAMSSKPLNQATYRITQEALVKHFTLSELNALTAFYGSPEGKSILHKFGPYMADVMSQVAPELHKAFEEAKKRHPEADEGPPPGSPKPGAPGMGSPKPGAPTPPK